ncbi:MAG: hypothetical protein GX195_04360 [Firmicutes bacterium]|nr:hypothetical protein [Bacillota bacterium]
MISHTHWDREWYLTFEQFRYRLVNLMDNLLDLLDADPQFRCFHLDAQTIILEDYLEVRPRRREDLVRHISAGRLLVGPWYLQNDEFLVSGESTIRNLLLGAELAEAFGGCMRVGYIPDQFGNISQMPQILNGFGIHSAVFARGYDARRRGQVELLWESPDGSQVLAVFMANWYNNAQRLPEEPFQALRFLVRSQEDLSWGVQSNHYLAMNGVDHLEAQENLSGILRGVQEIAPEDFAVVHSSLPDYIAAVQRALHSKLGKPFVGELREGDDYHILAGTLSSWMYLKQRNFALENELINWIEPLAGWSLAAGIPHKRQDHLDYIWRTLMKNHAHDSICGCSVDLVHREMMDRFSRVEQLQGEVAEASFGELTSLIEQNDIHERGYLITVFNNQPQSRSGVVDAVVEVPVEHTDQGFVLVDRTTGQNVPYSVVQKKQYSKRTLSPINLPGYKRVQALSIQFEAADIPQLGYKTYAFQPGGDGEKIKTEKASAEPVLENRFLRAQINEDGTIDLLHKASGEVFRGLGYYVDSGDAGDSYVYMTPKNDQVFSTLGLPAQLICVEEGPWQTRWEIRTVLNIPAELDARQETRVGSVSLPICTEVSLGEHDPYLKFKVTVDNRAKDHRLRVMFPTGLAADTAHAGAQFDIVERRYDFGAKWGRASHTAPNYGFVDVNDGVLGLAVHNNGLHEYELLGDEKRTLALTLLRCVEWIYDKDFDYPMEETRIPEAQCLGRHVFEFAVYPHQGNHYAGRVYQSAHAYLNPLRPVVHPRDRKLWQEGRPWVQDSVVQTTFHREDPYTALPRLPAVGSFCQLKAEHVVITSLRPNRNGDGLIIRLVNLREEGEEACFSMPGLKRGYRLSLDERQREELPLSGASLALEIPGKKIVTLEVILR